jgi:hypothetical protein
MSLMSELTTKQVLAVAALAGCDPRTVRAYLRGDLVRPSLHERIQDAIVRQGIARGDSAPTTKREA